MKKAILILSVFFFISCQKKKENPYIGNWYYDKIVDYDSSKTKMPKKLLEFEYAPYYNFEILNDSIIDFKTGFYHNINRNSSYYLGTETNYRIKDSSIIYYDKSDNEWDTLKVKKLNKDRMIVVGDYETDYQLIKKNNTYFNTKNYDAIVVDRSPCMGSCPFNSTYIDRKGNFYFKGYDYNTQNGNFFSKLDKESTNKLFKDFDEIDIFKLKDNYFVMASDSQTNVISFFKDGKLVKTIRSYIKSPIDLKIAFTKLSYAYQHIKLKYDYDKQFIFDGYVSFSSFSSKDKELIIKESESFYLQLQLHTGKKCNQKFEEKYQLDFNEFDKKSGIKKITTDGRYYKFIQKDNSFFIIDIGYNFIDKNPILKSDRE